MQRLSLHRAGDKDGDGRCLLSHNKTHTKRLTDDKCAARHTDSPPCCQDHNNCHPASTDLDPPKLARLPDERNLEDRHKLASRCLEQMNPKMCQLIHWKWKTGNMQRKEFRCGEVWAMCLPWGAEVSERLLVVVVTHGWLRPLASLLSLLHLFAHTHSYSTASASHNREKCEDKQTQRMRNLS